MRRLIRWAVLLVVIIIAIGVAGILSLNTVVKQLIEARLRAATGMDVTVGAVDVGLLSPTMTIDNFKIYNTADFGGSIFLSVPELHLEYDPFAVQSGNLHFKLVRLNLAEISLIQDKKGRLNIQDLAKRGGDKSSRQRLSDGGRSLKFTGIDVLNLTLGKFRLSNLGNGRAEEIEFGVTNQITRNVKSEADLAALNLLLAARAGVAATSSTNSPLDLSALLHVLTH